MSGRAGRPQFCNSATVVIMTKQEDRQRTEQLMVGSSVVESSLQHHLPEHLNAEIILGNIRSVEQAASWVRSTYLYMRMRRNGAHYGLEPGLGEGEVRARVQELCGHVLGTMARVGLVAVADSGSVSGTGLGQLMSRYYLAFSTMELLTSDMQAPTIGQLLGTICRSREMSDTVLRNTEKNILNNLNKNKEKITVKFPLNGKIKTKDMKVNILIQASLGSMALADPGLNLETPRLIRLASRILECLVEVVLKDATKSADFALVKNVLSLSKR